MSTPIETCESSNKFDLVDVQDNVTWAIAMIGNALRASRPVASDYDNETESDLYDCDVVERPSEIAFTIWFRVCYNVCKTLPVEDQKQFAEFVGFGKESK